MTRYLPLVLLAAMLGDVASAQAQSAPISCERLAALALPETTITSAAVAAGTFTLPSGGPPGAALGGGRGFTDLPDFCRVAATLAPSKDSNIRVEVWLPASGWNGKFLGVGNGGWSGAIGYGALANALRHGYASASTDTGHSGSTASFALGHPEKLIDFGYRAVHDMTVRAKEIIAAFYGNRPRLSYWSGCSSGGKQGLKEAQRFPDDYDGIVAGAPANFWTHLMTSGLWVAHTTLTDPARYIPREKFALIHKAVVDACDAADGVRDGVLEDPTRCRFDPKVLQCAGDEGPACLTPPQVESVRKMYTPVTNPRTGQQIFPGLAFGSELGWAAMAGGPAPFSISVEHFKYVVFKDPSWEFRSFDFDRHVALADELDQGLLNATDPDVKKFVGRGGKLLLYHGWSDQLISPQNTIDYYRSVMSTLGGAPNTAGAVRLFMVPAMAHCAVGEGTSSFDTLSAMERWVEQGKAPDQIVASHLTSGVADRTRPLCPYPQVAQYKGTGSTDEAASFACKAR